MKNRLYSNWTSKVPCYVVEKLFNKHPSGLLDRFATALKTQKLFGSNSHRREMEKKQARHPNKYSDNIPTFWHNHNNHQPPTECAVPFPSLTLRRVLGFTMTQGSRRITYPHPHPVPLQRARIHGDSRHVEIDISTWLHPESVLSLSLHFIQVVWWKV